MSFCPKHLVSSVNTSLSPSEVAEEAARTVAGVAEVSHTLIAHLQATAADVRRMESWIERKATDADCICPKSPAASTASA